MQIDRHTDMLRSDGRGSQMQKPQDLSSSACSLYKLNRSQGRCIQLNRVWGYFIQINKEAGSMHTAASRAGSATLPGSNLCRGAVLRLQTSREES